MKTDYKKKKKDFMEIFKKRTLITLTIFVALATINNGKTKISDISSDTKAQIEKIAKQDKDITGNETKAKPSKISQQIISTLAQEETPVTITTAQRDEELQKNFVNKVKEIQILYKAKKYADAVSAINKLFATPKYLPTTDELALKYLKTSQQLGAVVMGLITTVCEKVKKTSTSFTMIIKRNYRKSISFDVFQNMIEGAAEFSQGFTDRQNTVIKQTLTTLSPKV
jgi:hypothetical protein